MPLKVTKLTLQNIRCFEELELDFVQEGKPAAWTLLLGDNGSGKTTLLRALAMSLCDETSASGLLRELQGDMLREGAKEGTIRVELIDERTCEPYVSQIKITSEHGREALQQLVPEEHGPSEPSSKVPWDQVFTCGYGVARGTIGTEPYDKYGPSESLYTLFSNDAALWSTEVALARLVRKGAKESEILCAIEKVLMLEEGSVTLDDGVKVKGDFGSRATIGAAGDGYAATFAILADLLGWGMLHFGEAPGLDFSGIVFIDEVEQHLHPAWQRRIVGLLHQQFKNVQFIGTTHAPMCVIGTTDLKDGECNLVVLHREGERSVSATKAKIPRRRRADEVLTSFLFGLPTSSDDEIKMRIDRYADLSSREQRTPEEEGELEQLAALLEDSLGTGERPIEREIRSTVLEALEQRHQHANDRDRAAWELEIRRQLTRILSGPVQE